MDEREVRLRCIEAAAKNPVPHKDGFGAAVLEHAQRWAQWVLAGDGKGTLGLPKK